MCIRDSCSTYSARGPVGATARARAHARKYPRLARIAAWRTPDLEFCEFASSLARTPPSRALIGSFIAAAEESAECAPLGAQ
eukprot:10578332-Alexandrium_andersonii.AAC.1